MQNLYVFVSKMIIFLQILINMRSKDTFKKHSIIKILGLFGAIIVFFVTVMPYVTGKQDLPTLLNSISNIEGDKNKEEHLSVMVPDKILKDNKNTDSEIKPKNTHSQNQPTTLSSGIPSKLDYENKIGNKKQEKISKSRFNTKFRYPCSGNIDQIAGISLNHVHVTPSITSPSQPPVDGGAKVKINNTIYRDNKNWYEIIYVTGSQKYKGWLPTIYVIPSSNCHDN